MIDLAGGDPSKARLRLALSQIPIFFRNCIQIHSQTGVSPVRAGGSTIGERVQLPLTAGRWIDTSARDIAVFF